MTVSETSNGAGDAGDAQDQRTASGHTAGWEKEVTRSGHDYQPTPETAARHDAEMHRGEETPEDGETPEDEESE